MKLIDCHADIGMDVLIKHNQGESDVLKKYHLNKLKEGEIFGVSMACFFEGHESMGTAYAMVSELRKEIDANQDSIHLSLQGDFKEDKLNALISIEGMCFIQDNPGEFLRWAYNQGVRIGSLCWNDTNALATGTKGDPARGLTTLGKEAINIMNELNMIVDISHTNEKTFYDILEASKKPIIATHSNARKLCNVARNLTDQQIIAIANNQGLIGLNAARYFVDNDPLLQIAHTLAKHAKYMAELTDVKHICIGLDYMDFLEEPFGRDAMAIDLQDASMSQNLIKALFDVGFSESEVKAIAYQNVIDFLQKNL